jgi:DNA replication protein DnaC
MTLTPQRHKKQAIYLPRIKENPYRSLVLIGPHGCGKTGLAYAVYRRAVEENRPAVFSYMPDLLEELKHGEWNDQFIPSISVTALTSEARNAERWLLVFDDFNVGRATRFTGEAILRILNAAYNYNHQVIITAHCTMAKLKEHWTESGEGYGGSIIRRIEESEDPDSGEGALVMNFFAS